MDLGECFGVGRDDAQRCPFRVGVVVQRMDLHLAIGPDLDDVVHRVRGLIHLVGLGDAHQHLGCAHRPLAVHHLVPEPLGTDGVLMRHVLDPLAGGRDHLAQLRGRTGDAHQHHGVAVGIDTGGGDGDAHGGAGDRTCDQVLRARRSVGGIGRDDPKRQVRATLTTCLVDRLVLDDGLAAGVVVGDEAHLVLEGLHPALALGLGAIELLTQ